MNVIFCVYRSWNLKILEGLVALHKNKEWKIKLIVAPTDMELPDFLGIQVLKIKPTELEKCSEKIKSENPKVIICYGWSWIIPKSIINIAPCLVLHPSPLPKYRGGSPIQNQLLDGVKKSAVSIIYAAEKIDAGNILAQEPISFEGYLQDIVDRISTVGLKLTINILDRMVREDLIGITQNESEATIVKRRKPSMSEITIEEIKTKSAEYIYDKVRGLQDPYPEPFIVCGDGKKLFLNRVHLENQ